MFDIDFILANTALNPSKVNQRWLDRQRITFEVAASRHTARYEAAFKTLSNLMENGGTIRKVEYTDLKYNLDHALEECYENYVQPMFDDVNGTPVEERVYSKLNITKNITFELHPSSTLLINAIAKKIAKLKMADASESDKKFIALVQKIVDVFLPVQQALETLKNENRIVKGRAPRAEPVPENPNKDVKTCPCCLNKFAVMGGKVAKGSKAGFMVHHGFKRPGTGYQTTSCHGVAFKPLEVSTKGLVWYIDVCLKPYLESQRKGLKNVSKLVSINNPNYDEFRAKREGDKYKVPKMLDKQTTDSMVWKRQIEIIVAKFEMNIEYTESDIKMRQNILDNWKPGKGV